MNTADVLRDAFDRVRGVVHRVLDGLTAEQLEARVGPEANSIAWLVWHLTRIQDDHVADVANAEQVWTAAGYARRFALPFSDHATGYGHSSDDVAAVRADATLLREYYDAVHEQTMLFVDGLADADLNRVVDTRWDPPVTLGVRLVSVIGDDLQHAGQAAFVRGILTSPTDP
jgi:uncharacterized damage-inducible protein DinB